MILRSEPCDKIGDDGEFGGVSFSGIAESVCEDAEAFEVGNGVFDPDTKAAQGMIVGAFVLPEYQQRCLRVGL